MCILRNINEVINAMVLEWPKQAEGKRYQAEILFNLSNAKTFDAHEKTNSGKCRNKIKANGDKCLYIPW